jgi:hypothetical protein
MAIDSFSEITSIEKRLKLPKGFYHKLLKDDDWSFVIKLNAIFEALCTHVLVARLDAETLSNELSELTYADSKFGKLLMLRKLGALEVNQYKSLIELARIRNLVVHRIENIAFTLKQYLKLKDSNEKKSFCNIFGYNAKEIIKIGNRSVQRNSFIIENPKIAIWLNALDILACLNLEFEILDIKEKKKAYRAIDEFLQSLQKRLLTLK